MATQYRPRLALNASAGRASLQHGGSMPVLTPLAANSASLTPSIAVGGNTAGAGPASAPPASREHFKMRRTGGSSKMTPINKSRSSPNVPRPAAHASPQIIYDSKTSAKHVDNVYSPGIVRIKSDIDDDADGATNIWNTTTVTSIPFAANHRGKRQRSQDEDFPAIGTTKRARGRFNSSTVARNVCPKPQQQGSPEASKHEPVSAISTAGYRRTQHTESTDGKPYSKYRDSNGSLVDTYGALIPSGYTKDSDAEFPWHCPVRGCSAAFAGPGDLGIHFKLDHRSTTYHDNGDGTLTNRGTYGDRLRDPAIVVSREMPKPLIKAAAARAVTAALSEPWSAGSSTSIHDADDERRRSSENDTESEYRHDAKEVSEATSRSDSDSERRSGSSDELGQTPRELSEMPSRSSTESLADQSGLGEPPTVAEPSPKPGDVAAASAHDNALVKSGEPAAPSGAADFSAPLPPNPELMWKFVQQYLVVHRGDTIPDKMYVRDFLNLRRVRDLEWNETWVASHQFKDRIPRDITSLLMHVTGPYAPKPCTKCKGGSGPYKGCVVMPPDAPYVPQFMLYGCANCVYHGGQTNCSLQDAMRRETKLRFPHLDAATVRREFYSAANIAAAKKSAKSKAAAAQQGKREMKRKTERLEPRKSTDLATLAAEYSMRNRTGKAGPNRNSRELSRSSLQTDPLASPGRPSSSRRGSTTEPNGPENGKAKEGFDHVRSESMDDASDRPPSEASEDVVEIEDDTPQPPGPFNLRPRKQVKVSIKTAGGFSNGAGGSSRVTATIPQTIARTAASPMRMVSGREALEMEDWEIGPGVIPSKQDETENIAFSNAYLTSQKLVAIADGISCRVEFVKPGCSLTLNPDPRSTRICSIWAGKVRVESEGETFNIGSGGHVKVRPGASVILQNRLYIDAYLQIMAIAEAV